jgi:hypothetical protein
VLADITKSKEERVEALKFLVHFVGDVHQPLPHLVYGLVHESGSGEGRAAGIGRSSL